MVQTNVNHRKIGVAKESLTDCQAFYLARKWAVNDRVASLLKSR